MRLSNAIGRYHLPSVPYVATSVPQGGGVPDVGLDPTLFQITATSSAASNSNPAFDTLMQSLFATLTQLGAQ